MQLKTLLVGALLPLGLLANPTPEAAAVDAPEVDAPELDARGFSRPQHCAIVGGSRTVNCRRGPGTKWGIKMKLKRGVQYPVWCVHSAQCVTINGFRNWYVYGPTSLLLPSLLLSFPFPVYRSSLTDLQSGWHYIKQHDCFVSGHYTDNNCTYGMSWSQPPSLLDILADSSSSARRMRLR